MKKSSEDINISGTESSKLKFKDFFQKQADKLRHRQFTCPFCREILNGLSEFGSHLKKHCT